ncbi:MAG: polysaccharide deacetylase family protein [Solibacillus sp.]
MNQHRKKRGPWIDVTLIGSILVLGAIIIFLTVFNGEFKFQKTDISIAAELGSEITEEASAFTGIKIATDISNDPSIPYAIQYPLSESEEFNEAVTAYITTAKDHYINTMRLKQNVDEDASGELNISFETFEYDERYYSFVLKNKTATHNDEKISVQTFLYNFETKEMFDMHTLLAGDLKSLETFAAHVRSELKKQPELKGLLLEDELTKATEAKWRQFSRFALIDESLVLYFDELEIAKKEAGTPTLTTSLSFLNPLLAPEFQIQMMQADTIVPSTPTEADKNKKHVALTFDDGPHPKVTKQILDLLKKYDAKATFFMLGSRVEYYPDIVREVSAAGHEIGNHTWTHPVLTKMDSAKVLKEFEQTEHAIFTVLGENTKIFRPPYGATNERVKNLIPRTSVNWTIDTLDWKYRNATKLLPMVEQNMHNNAIILMHDIHQSTADGLESVLKYMQEEGYEFLTVSEILQYR